MKGGFGVYFFLQFYGVFGLRGTGYLLEVMGVYGMV